MKFEVSRSACGVAAVRLLLSALFLAVGGIFLVQLPANAQTPKGISVTKRLQRFGLTRAEIKPLMPLIEKQTDSLAKIYAKYSNQTEAEYVLVSTTNFLWEDLKANRQYFSAPNGRQLTKRQQNALLSVYLDLEKETVMLLLDDEVPIWGDELELSDRQMDQLYDICVSDITRKQTLIGRPFASEAIRSRIKAVSEETEKRIVKMLLPEQQQMWEKSRQRSKESELRSVA